MLKLLHLLTPPMAVGMMESDGGRVEIQSLKEISFCSPFGKTISPVFRQGAMDLSRSSKVWVSNSGVSVQPLQSSGCRMHWNSSWL